MYGSKENIVCINTIHSFLPPPYFTKSHNPYPGGHDIYNFGTWLPGGLHYIIKNSVILRDVWE